VDKTNKQKRSYKSAVRFTAEEFNVIEQAANLAGVEIAPYLRQEAVRAAQAYVDWSAAFRTPRHSAILLDNKKSGSRI